MPKKFTTFLESCPTLVVVSFLICTAPTVAEPLATKAENNDIKQKDGSPAAIIPKLGQVASAETMEPETRRPLAGSVTTNHLLDQIEQYSQKQSTVDQITLMSWLTDVPVQRMHAGTNSKEPPPVSSLPSTPTAAPGSLLDQIDSYSNDLESIEQYGDDSTVEDLNTEMEQINSVFQLTDVQPTDWAFEALKSLVETYGCIQGYPDSSYRGNRSLTRYEFAAGLNACLNRIGELMANQGSDRLNQENLDSIQRLQTEFAAELAALQGRVDNLEERTAQLEGSQFSTTTILRGAVSFSLGDSFFGDNIFDASNNSPGLEPSQTFLTSGARIDLQTSFTGKDRLRVRLQAANSGNPLRQRPGRDPATGSRTFSTGSLAPAPNPFPDLEGEEDDSDVNDDSDFNIDSEIESLEDLSDDLIEEFDSLDEEYDDLLSKREDLVEEFDTLVGEIDELDAEIDELDAEINELEAEIAMLDPNDPNEALEIADLEDQISDLEDQISDLEDQIDDLEDQIANRNDRLDKLEAEIPELDEQLNELDVQIAELEAILDEIDTEIEALGGFSDDDEDESLAEKPPTTTPTPPSQGSKRPAPAPPRPQRSSRTPRTPRKPNRVSLPLIDYGFPIGKNTRMSIFASGGTHALYADKITEGSSNPVYSIGGRGAGIGLNHRFSEQFRVDLGYLAGQSFNPSDPGGLFNGNYSALAQLVFEPTRNFSMGLTYIHTYGSSGVRFGAGTTYMNNLLRRRKITNNSAESNSYALEASYRVSRGFVVGAWASYTNINIFDRGDADLWNYGLTFSFPDLGKEGNQGLLTIGTDTTLRGLEIDGSAISVPSRDYPLYVDISYKYKLTDNITLTPKIQWRPALAQDFDNDDYFFMSLQTSLSF